MDAFVNREHTIQNALIAWMVAISVGAVALLAVVYKRFNVSNGKLPRRISNSTTNAIERYMTDPEIGEQAQSCQINGLDAPNSKVADGDCGNTSNIAPVHQTKSVASC